MKLSLQWLLFLIILTSSTAVLAHPDDSRWLAGYGLPGMNGPVTALAVGADGLYAGGVFVTAGNQAANRIARWDGSWWHRLGDGLDAEANAIVADGSDIYVGGGFSTAGGILARCIAKWDGATWSALGPGLNGQVYAIAINGSDIYAAGSFNHSGATAVANIARWDGSQWNDVGGGTNGPVNALLVHGGDLYASGFTMAGGVSINGIARWDGSSWSQVGAGLAGYVSDIATDGTDIYVANVVSSVYGTVVESQVQKWDGATWSAVLGQQFPYGPMVFDGWMKDITFHQGSLHVAGSFNGVADLWRLIGPYWFSMSVEECEVLEPFGAQLIVGGHFREIAGAGAHRIAAFDGSSFHALAESQNDGFDGTVYDIALNGTHMYVGGGFSHIGTRAFNNIARWDGTQWNGLGPGVDFTVRAIAIDDGSVFAGGYNHGGPQEWEARIQRWDGSSWQELTGPYTGGEIRDMVVWNGDIHVGGRFENLGNVPVIGIARWAGGTWHDVGGGVWGDYNDQSVFCLAAGDDALYAGGRFFGAGSVSALRIARWDGTNWSPLGAGLAQHPFTIAVDGNMVYASASLTTGGIKPNMWDGTSWHPLGSGFILSANSSVVVNHDVYFAGSFANAGGDIDRLARWDGSDWHPLGSGLGSEYADAWAVASDGEYLYVGGEIETAGDKASVGFAKWELEDTTVPVLVQSFTAKAGAGTVDLKWSITDASEAVGFWIARENLGNGKQSMANDVMLPRGTSRFVDTGVRPGESYRYQLEVVLQDGSMLSMPRDVTVAAYALSLGQNVPNPFNPSTIISFTTAERAIVDLRIFDAGGRLIATLVNEMRPPGNHDVQWTGTNDTGERVASGVYFVRLHSGKQTLTSKISLIK